MKEKDYIEMMNKEMQELADETNWNFDIANDEIRLQIVQYLTDRVKELKQENKVLKLALGKACKQLSWEICGTCMCHLPKEDEYKCPNCENGDYTFFADTFIIEAQKEIIGEKDDKR